MAEFPLREAVQGKDVEIIRMPFELRPFPSPTLRPEGEYLQRAWAHSVYPMAAKMGIAIRLPDISPQPYTRSAFEGLEYAKDHGAAGAYNWEVLSAFFQRGENIGEPDVLAAAARGCGLDGSEFQNALLSRRYAERVDALLQHAYEDMQVTGVPLFVIGGTRLSGVQPRERLEAVIVRQS